jgi:hypothetical protein
MRWIKTAPADLTLISKRASGTFPFATVKSKITGDDVTTLHLAITTITINTNAVRVRKQLDVPSARS